MDFAKKHGSFLSFSFLRAFFSLPKRKKRRQTLTISKEKRKTNRSGHNLWYTGL